MAAPCVKAQRQILGSIFTKYLRASVLQRSQVLTCASPCFGQVRHKNGRQRVREAKVYIDTNQKFVSKKERLKLKAMVVKTDIQEECTILAGAPVDNVWVHKYYPPTKFTIEDAIERHKAFAQPDMLDNMEGHLYLDMKLDLTTKKKTKFMKTIQRTLMLPHAFPYGSPPSILVLCKTEENLSIAATLGAKHYGDPTEINKLIANGVLNPKDFHHVVCTVDCTNDILPIRSHFRDKFPQKAKDNLGLDLKAMYDLHYNGYTYESTKVTDSQGRLQVPCGIMAQPTEDIVENFKTYIESICQHRSIALGPFIESIKVVAPPSPEQFLVRVEDYVPGYQNEEFDSDDEEEAEKAGE